MKELKINKSNAMKLINQDIETYFKEIDLTESLLLEYFYVEDRKELRLVFDIPRVFLNENANLFIYDKEWVEYVFSNVDNYRRKKGTDTAMWENLNNYLLKRDRRNKVLHYLEVIYNGANSTAEIDFGDFGTVWFQFTEVTITALYGKALQIAINTWQYTDALSGKPIDYYDPFKNGPDQINF